MFINLFILIDCFLCNSYPCVLFESLPHVIREPEDGEPSNVVFYFVWMFIHHRSNVLKP